ncbi:hypothetical protein LZG04_20400 [Saccharothrix sp. S26]|uniref:hypothetical protein n=1 Tax=Saccharothrix sp. S26 TaxID=2907215 RepID=UPI001F355E09|nr:hypothetical protein [Saccharothrix sp. S26]MCE6997144.1 hypothetical protein [Saccharothrix sp. S26]
MHSNNVSGFVVGTVVQVRDVHNDIQVDGSHRLYLALANAVVDLGGRKGVRVAPGLVLTAGATGPELRAVPGDGPYACVGAEQAEPFLLRHVDRSPGAPVLNWRTGAVCGVFDVAGAVQPLVEVDAAVARAGRANTAWLDLLEPEQLVAGNWRHQGPALRLYLSALAAADRAHENQWAHHRAPPLSRIHLKRTASQRESGDDEPAEVIPADRLTDFPGAQVIAGPGAGKSSLVRTLTAESARRWVEHGDGEYVPVPVRAEDLAHGEALSDALAHGVARAFGLKLGHDQLVRLLQAEPLPGVSWLVLVDGLDEVFPPDVRERVIRQIREHREDRTHRFLVTSRPLNPHELVPLADRETSPTYWLELFSDADLREFAVRYLREDGHPRPEAAADDLLGRITRTKLAKLAHVPLFATMLCHLYTETGGGELPANQTQLYRRFIEVQLRKVHNSEAMATVRGRVAGWGGAAEEAFVRFAWRLTDALADVAHDALIGGVRATPLEAVVRWLGPTPVDDRTWAECVTDVLRLSGLFIQYGKRFDYLHHTFEEYFAAARIARGHPRPTVRKLFPRLRWPWPDAQIKVFLAAHWAEEGHDLGPVLRRLLWWPYAAGNVGFLAELVNHGVALPEDVTRKAVRWLEAELRRTADVGAWQDRARWLYDLDADRAVAVLRDAVLNRARNDDRFQALRFLIEVAPRVAAEVAPAFFADPGVEPQAQAAAGALLHQRDPESGLAVFAGLAEAENVEARLAAVRLLAPHRPGEALDVARRVVTGWEATDHQRLRAARAAVELDRARGTDLVCRLLRHATSTEVCEQAMELLSGHDLPRLTAVCEELFGDASAHVDVRYAATLFLVDRVGRPSTLLTDLVAGRDFPAERRVRAALRNRGQEAARRILVDVVQSLHPDDGEKLWAIEQLMVVAPEDAGPHLAALVRNEHQDPAARVKAVTLAAPHVRRDELVAMYAVLADSPALDAKSRFTFAVDALKADPSVGAERVLAIARGAGATAERLKAAAELGRAGQVQAEFAAYRSIAVDDLVPDKDRVKAALSARKARRDEGADLVRGLAVSGVSGRPRLRLIDALPRRDRAELLERFAADRDEDEALRLDAAERLANLDTAVGRRALNHLADDATLPSWIRTRARLLADQ